MRLLVTPQPSHCATPPIRWPQEYAYGARISAAQFALTSGWAGSATSVAGSLLLAQPLAHAHALLAPLASCCNSLGSIGGVFGSGLLAACLWAPFIEEILFRAGVQRLLRLLLASPRLARLLASLAFGLAHLPAEAAMWPAALPGAIAAATASHFCFGLCFERRGLPSAVGAHSAHNVAINVLDRCAKPARLLIGAAIYAAALVAWRARASEESPEYT